MSLIYTAETDALKARDRAFSLSDAKLAAGNDVDTKLKWMMTAVDDAYSPYLVKIHAMAGSKATISFINGKTGEVMANQHAIDLSDRELVWNKLPSTLEGWIPGETDCAFLFLSSKIRDITVDASLSEGGSGKWPPSCAVTTPLEEMQGLVREMIEKEPRVLEHLPAHKGERLSKLVGKLPP